MNWWTTLSASVRPYFLVGGLRLNYYGLIIGAGLLAAVWLARRRAHLYGLKRKDVEAMMWWAVIPGLIGARIYHVLDNWAYYLVRPFDMVAVWNGGLAIYGGLLGGVLGLIYAARIQRIKIWALLDLLAPSLILAQAIGRWGNFFNQEGYGPPTDLPWKIFISPSRRLLPYLDYDFFHPMFLYESLWNLSVFISLLLISRKKVGTGVIAGWYLVLYGGGRFLVEFGRLDTAVLYGFKVAQVLSILIIFLGLGIVFHGHLSSGLVKFRRKRF